MPHSHTPATPSLLSIADRFENRRLRSDYQGVADTCRLPYWDWTKSNLPKILTDRSVTVLDEHGAEVEVRNPFAPYQYVVSHALLSGEQGLLRCQERKERLGWGGEDGLGQ